MSIILHNLFVCITRQLEDHLPGGKYHDPGDDLVKETQTCPKDNVPAERMFAGLDYLKRKSPNMSALSMQGVLLWSMNKTADFLNECSPEKREELVKKAVRSRKKVVKLYQDKIRGIKQNRREARESRMMAQAAKERLLAAQTITNTENVLKVCGFICKTSDDVDRLVEKLTDESSRRNALLAQIRYYKCVNRGTVKGSLFFVTSGGKPMTTSQLSANMKSIIHQLKAGVAHNDEGTSSSSQSSDKETSRNELKQKLLAKLNRGTAKKRKCPFPAGDVVGKKIKHTCLCPSGDKLVTYSGKVIRESTPNDMEELMEEEYKAYHEKGYKFYTVVYDPPYNQMFIYPLRKEWDDNLLTID